MRLQILVNIRFDDSERSLLNRVACTCKPEWLFSDEQCQKTNNLLSTERTWSLQKLYEAWAYLQRLASHYTTEHNASSPDRHPGKESVCLTIQTSATTQLSHISEARELLSKAILLLDEDAVEEILDEEFPPLWKIL